jgi:hypothetical protein
LVDDTIAPTSWALGLLTVATAGRKVTLEQVRAVSADRPYAVPDDALRGLANPVVHDIDIGTCLHSWSW